MFLTYFSTDCRIVRKTLCWRWLPDAKWFLRRASVWKSILQVVQRRFASMSSLPSSSEVDSSESSIRSAAVSPSPKITRPWITWHRFRRTLSVESTLEKQTLNSLLEGRNHDSYISFKSDLAISCFKSFSSRNRMKDFATLVTKACFVLLPRPILVEFQRTTAINNISRKHGLYEWTESSWMN